MIKNVIKICISEIYPDKSGDNDVLSIGSCNIIRTHHPCKPKERWCIFDFEEQLKLKQMITHYFCECILCEISTENKSGYIAVRYGYPSQTASEFGSFLENFEKPLYQIQHFILSLVVMLGDYNTRTESWCNEDITSNKGLQIDSLTTTYGLQQLISGRTHIFSNSSTCID